VSPDGTGGFEQIIESVGKAVDAAGVAVIVAVRTRQLALGAEERRGLKDRPPRSTSAKSAGSSPRRGPGAPPAASRHRICTVEGARATTRGAPEAGEVLVRPWGRRRAAR